MAGSEGHGDGEDAHTLVSQEIFCLGALSGTETSEVYADYGRDGQHGGEKCIIQPTEEEVISTGGCDVHVHIL